ncbi:MAG: IPTL-CTERM sorting domain-containing protein [Thiogranum sp.]
MKKLIRRSMSIGAVAAITLFSHAAVAQTTLGFDTTADDQFELWVSTAADNTGGSSIITGNDWQTAYTAASVALAPGVVNYIHVRAVNAGDPNDAGNPGAFIGDFTLSGNQFEFLNSTQSLLTDSANWTVNLVGFGDASAVFPTPLGVRDSEPWLSAGPPPTEIDPLANWIWDLDGVPVNTPIYLTAVINPVESDLSMIKVAPPSVGQGTELTYDLSVYNDGPADADNVTITDTLPAGVTFVSASAGCTHLAGVVTCDVGSLANDSLSSNYEIVVGIPADMPLGEISNSAVTDSDSPDSNQNNNTSSAPSQVVTAVAAEGTALFAVDKWYVDDNNETPVTLTLECTSGSYAPSQVTVYPDAGWGSGKVEHMFVVDNIPGSIDSCTVVEDDVAGYTPFYFCQQDWSMSLVDTSVCADAPPLGPIPGTTACGWNDIVAGDSNMCLIVNEQTPVEVDVTKVWEVIGSMQADIDPDVGITLWCDAPIVDGYSSGFDRYYMTEWLYESDGDFDNEDDEYVGIGTANFEVYPDFYPTNPDPELQQYTTCWATENIQNDYVEVDNGCGTSLVTGTIKVSTGMGDECTITNTAFFEGIPTLNQYGMAIMALLMLGMGFVGFRRFV